MFFLLEALVISVLLVGYWLNRQTRMRLAERLGERALRNVYQTARNFSFMLQKREPLVKGNTGLLRQGAVLYSFHFGIWEIMPRALNRIGHEIGIIVNRHYEQNKARWAKILDQCLDKFRGKGKIRIFHKEDTIALVRFIKRGGVLGMLVDGNTFYSKFSKAQKLAKLCKVPLVSFAAYRKNNAGILEIGCNLSEILKQRPLDYVWAYKSRGNQ